MSMPVYLEVFSGSGELSKAFGRAGEFAIAWDILHGPAYDLTKPAAVALIRGWIRAGLIKGLHMGTPCTSFSRILGVGPGPAALRSSEFPLGLPDLVGEKNKAKLQIGNQLMQVSCALFHACLLAHVPVTLENPATSYLWSTPQVHHLLARHRVGKAVTEFCMWGKAWRKSTSFMFSNLLLDRLQCRRCCGAPRGLCARTLKPHIQLRGLTSTGAWWTKVAEPYPATLCRALVSCFLDGHHSSRAAKFEGCLGPK